MPTASTTARALAREQLTGAILREAREQLATVGPAQLSVRAIAREVGMASSAVYRYFPSRDELLTELLVIGYTELGEQVTAAEAAVVERTDYLARWLAIAHTMRDWCRAHPFDFGLLYGSPVPGYAAPRRTVEPAVRVPLLILDLLRDQHLAGLQLAAATDDPPELHPTLALMREAAGADLSDELVLLGLRAWAGLLGSLTLELFGHLVNAIEDHDTYFAAAVRRLAPVVDPGAGEQ